MTLFILRDVLINYIKVSRAFLKFTLLWHENY
jgi:hypothetical protein